MLQSGNISFVERHSIEQITPRIKIYCTNLEVSTRLVSVCYFSYLFIVCRVTAGVSSRPSFSIDSPLNRVGISKLE